MTNYRIETAKDLQDLARQACETVAAQIAGTPTLLRMSLRTTMAPCAYAWMLSAGVVNETPADTTTPLVLPTLTLCSR